jgi:hypothetical protein
MKINKITFSVDKKLSINYNSVGMSIGVEADVGEDEGLAVATQLRELAEGLIDGMIVESIQALPALTAKAKKVNDVSIK